MTTWAVVGAAGMLGRAVVRELGATGAQVRPLTRRELDVTDPSACEAALEGADVVVNCSAWTAVDDAEEQEARAFAVNALGPAHLAAASARTGARFVHVSTDYVFSGAAQEPYGEDHPLSPRSAYGRGKAAGEWAARAGCADALVVRTAWLYGDGPCFPRTIARLLAERDTITVVDDQVGQPTWTEDVASLLARLVETDVPAGVYHATSSGRATWRDLARSVAASLSLDPERVLPTTSEAFVRPAPRPAWSVLGHDALRRQSVAPIGDWRERWDEAAQTVLTTA